jgi:DNA-binding transcriptional regulator PaaX
MKNKSEITKIILKSIFMGGAIAIASTSPTFVSRILPNIIKYAKYKIKNKKQQKSFYSTFNRLKNKGMIKIEYRGKQIHISLTEEGKKMAGKYQINDLKIDKPKKWDKKWRILIFDIENKQNIKREALRGKIKEWGLYQLQKSVWVYPYDFQKEIILLREFFGLTDKEMKVILATAIENDQDAREFFGLKK